MQFQTTQGKFELPFEFPRLVRSPGHLLQFEDSLKDTDDDLGHQVRTQGPSQNIFANIVLLGARMID